VFGAGDATGAAIASRFTAEGFSVCGARRNGEKLQELINDISSTYPQSPTPRAFSCDARIEEQVVSTVNEIEENVGPISVCVHNIGANVKFNVAETTPRVYRKVWEMVAFSAFLVGKEVSKRMVDRGEGTIIFTGATASTRGGSGFSAFSGAMQAKRALAQSMARELGPKGVHVSHVVIDGAIDTEWIRSNFPEQAAAAAKVGGLLEPAAIAENILHLHRQPRNAWTHELDLRPYTEKW
jgi:NAD(P)-dependent dehydrogenase (short-subunit alcohol dehydrogenase family)